MTNLEKYAQWYVATSFSGNENRVVENIINKAKSNKCFGPDSENPKIEAVKILTEKILRVTPTGKEKLIEKNIYSGYIFIKMIMDDDTWFMVRNTTGVTGFVGSSGKGARPFPITDIEIEALLTQQAITEKVAEEVVKSPDVEKVVYHTDLEIGEEVEITEGPFEGQTGKIITLDNKKGIANVSIEFFGRLTNVEIPFSDLKKIII